MRQVVPLYSPVQAYAVMAETVWPNIKAMLMAGQKLVLEVREDKRTLAQNRLMWSVLGDLSDQVEWCGKRLTPEGWKEWITGHLCGQELLPNMDGTGFISISRGRSTSNMTVKEMTAVIELAHAFGAERDVQWSKTSLGRTGLDVDPETGEIVNA